MSELAEFLLARIAEDEAEAERDREHFVSQHGLSELAEWRGWGSAYRNPARVLAECEAKRRIVDGLSDGQLATQLCDGELPGGYWAQGIALRALALPYADHPDYREEWKP